MTDEPLSRLELVVGHAPGQSLRVRAATPLEAVERLGGNIVRCRLEVWRRVVVLTTRAESKRAFVIEPSEEDSEIAHGPFRVRGRFKIVEKANNPKKAGDLYTSADVG